MSRLAGFTYRAVAHKLGNLRLLGNWIRSILTAAP